MYSTKQPPIRIGIIKHINICQCLNFNIIYLLYPTTGYVALMCNTSCLGTCKYSTFELHIFNEQIIN